MDGLYFSVQEQYGNANSSAFVLVSADAFNYLDFGMYVNVAADDILRIAWRSIHRLIYKMHISSI